MRIAILILGLAATVLVGAQSFFGYVIEGIAEQGRQQEAAAVGLLVALLFLIGTAFVLGVPLVSALAFLLAAAVAIPTGTSTSYSDLVLWGWVGIILAAMSFVAFYMKRRRRKRARASATAGRQDTESAS
jgi:hypothetical protein